MRERKIYTGKRGGKYVIVNGEKRYLEKSKSKSKSKSKDNIKISFEDLKKLAKKNNISTKSESGKNVGKQLTKEKLILKLYRHGIKLNKFGKENYNIQPRLKIFNLSCPPCPQCPSIPSCPYNCKCNNNMQPQMMQPLMMQPQMMQPQMMQPQMMQPQMIQQQPTQPTQPTQSTQPVQNNPKPGLEGEKLIKQPIKERQKLKPEEIKGEGMDGAIKQIQYLKQLMDEDPSLTRAQALKKLKQMDGNKKSPPPVLDPSKIPTPPPPPPTLDPSKIPKPPPPPPTLDPSKIPTPPSQSFGNRKYYKQYYGYYNKKKSIR